MEADRHRRGRLLCGDGGDAEPLAHRGRRRGGSAGAGGIVPGDDLYQLFATGGTEEEWAGREMDVIVDYEIKSQTEDRVSFVVTFGESWVASMTEKYCYNLDLAENRDITLADLLGEDWVERCNEAVRAGIAASVDQEGFSLFFTPEQGGFTTVDETTHFYIRADGVPVLVFPEYSIAAGAAGSPEFPVE